MFKIALLPNDVKTRGIYLGSRKLPSNYMADFSLMGFVVDRYEDALDVINMFGESANNDSNGGIDEC